MQVMQLEARKNSAVDNKQSKLPLLKQLESAFPDIVMLEGSPSKSPLSNRSEKNSRKVVFATFIERNRPELKYE